VRDRGGGALLATQAVVVAFGCRRVAGNRVSAGRIRGSRSARPRV
jgi:hypothetical protein